MFQQLTAVGRIGRDIELQYTGGGTPVTNISVAVESSYKKGDKWEKETEWLSVAAFGKTAEFLAQNASKGSLVFVSGRLKTRSWDKDGVKHYKTEVISDRILLLEPRSNDSGQPAPAARPASRPAPARAAAPPARPQAQHTEELTDDDLPF